MSHGASSTNEWDRSDRSFDPIAGALLQGLGFHRLHLYIDGTVDADNGSTRGC